MKKGYFSIVVGMVLLLTVVAFPARADIVNSPNWSGHVVRADMSSSYYEIGCSFVVSRVYHSVAKDTQALGQWCGLGNSNIVQAGVSSVVFANGGPTEYEMFWEDYPNAPQSWGSTKPGDNITVEIIENWQSPGTSYISVCDTTANLCSAANANPTPYEAVGGSDTADFVVENPESSFNYPLPHFTTVNNSFDWYANGAGYYNLTGGPPGNNNTTGNDLWQITSPGPPDALPSGIGVNEFWTVPGA